MGDTKKIFIETFNGRTGFLIFWVFSNKKIRTVDAREFTTFVLGELERLMPYFEFFERLQLQGQEINNVANFLATLFFDYIYDSIDYIMIEPSKNPKLELEKDMKLLDDVLVFLQKATEREYTESQLARPCLKDMTETINKIKDELLFLQKEKKCNLNIEMPLVKQNIYYKEKPSQFRLKDYLTLINKKYNLKSARDIKELLTAMTMTKDNIIAKLFNAKNISSQNYQKV